MITEGSVEYAASAYHIARTQASATLKSTIESRLRDSGADYDVWFGGHKEDHVTYDSRRDDYICTAEVRIHGDVSLDAVFPDATEVHEHPVQRH